MTASLPQEVQQVFDRFITTEYTTVDSQGQAITWPVTPYYSGGAQTIDVTTGLGYPKKAEDARSNPQVALLFSDPTGSGLERPPAVLVQGTAIVDDEDLDANRERYVRESVEKLPATRSMHPPKPIRRMFDWYYARLYVYVRPERVYVWPEGDFTREPTLYGSHVEEVRSGHVEEPEVPKAPATGGPVPWDERLRELGDRYPTAVVSVVAPDGFPMSARVAIETDEAASRIRLRDVPVGMPLAPGRACLTAHEHAPEFEWQVNFQVRGNLVQEDGRWSIVPRRLVGGFELPPTSMLARYRLNARKILRFRRNAKKTLKKRGERQSA
jgi:pyridoxamine 5'-phosphate oxidase-like protein